MIDDFFAPQDDEPTGLEGAGSAYNDSTLRCQLCTREPAQRVKANLSGISWPLRLCFPCQSHWLVLGIEVTAVGESVDGAGPVPGLAKSTGSPTAATHWSR